MSSSAVRADALVVFLVSMLSLVFLSFFLAPGPQGGELHFSSINRLEAYFPDEISSSNPVRVSFGNASVEFYAQGASKRSGEKFGGGVVYNGVFESTDLRYYFYGGGVKEELVLNGPNAPRRFSFNSRLRAMKASLEGDGSLSFRAVEVGLVFSLPRPFVLDGQGRFLRNLDYELSGNSSDALISISVPEEVFRGASYPLVIDPTVILYTNQTSAADGYVEFSQPSTYTRNTNAATMLFGTLGAATTDRAFLDFNTSDIPSTATVTGLNLTVYVSTKQDCLGGVNATEFRNLTYPAANISSDSNLYAYLANGTVWATRYDFNSSIGKNDVVLGSSAQTQLQDQLAQKWFSIAVKGTESCAGMGSSVRGALNTTEATPAESRPYLTVVYTASGGDTTAPNVTAVNSPANQFNSSTASITFNVTATDNTDLKNVSIFHNATGIWHRNATNSSLTVANNNSWLLVTVSSLPENNRTSWIAEVCDSVGNCAQYNANQTFIVDLTAPNVTTVNTASNLNASSQGVTFNVTVKDNMQLANASIFHNATGIWHRNATNSSLTAIHNNTPILVTVSNLPEGNRSFWVMEACDVAGNCAQYNANRTLIVDLSSPSVTLNSPSDNLNSSSQTVVLNATVSDNVRIANVSFYHNATGTWHLNSTNSSVPNASFVSLSLANFPENNRTAWNVRACDDLGNCAFASANRTLIVDLTSPNVTAVNSPANNLNSSSQSITFNVTVKDNAQLANVSIFTSASNSTGLWARNATNSSLTAIQNNTPILVVVVSIPANVSFTWVAEACDVAGNCVQYNANRTAIVDLSMPSVTLNSPADNLNSSSQSITLNATAFDANGIINISFYHNATGIWHVNSTNSSVPNASQVLLSLANFPQNNRTVWNVLACDFAGNCAFAASNRTFIVDLTAPNVTAVNSPANNYNSSSQPITFSVTATDNAQLANVSIFTSLSNSTGLWARNATNSSLSAIQNNTPILVTVSSIPANVSFTWVAEACDVAGNCAQYNANRTAIVDLTAPNITVVNSPSNNYNSSSQSITFSATVIDNVQLANVSIFTSASNSTGLWARNSTNSSLSAVQNNTPILVAVASIPANVSFTWVMEACDVAGNCAQYNANRTAIIDLTGPNVTAVNSPANNLNSSSQSITFNVTVTDNVQLANVSIFTSLSNSTGLWARNATNSSLSTIQNNTPILVTVSSIPANVSFTWVAEACDVAGNCVQYNANRTAIIDVTGPNVTAINSPANNYNSSSQSITFNVTVKDNVQLANVSIFHNATGTWLRNATNSSLSAIQNNTPILVSVSSLPEGTVTSWLVEACDVAGNCAFYNANRTLVVDLTAPNVTFSNTANNLNSSSQSITFNVTVKDNVQLANASIFHNATGTWLRNATNSSLGVIYNNTPILVSVSNVPSNARFLWIMEACDAIGNCAFYNANLTAIVDLTAPNVTTINSPSNAVTLTSQSFTFNVTVQDNVQLVNASIFHNASGIWARNATNSSLTAVHNNTPILVTVNNLPENNQTTWVMEACDVAGNCAFYNANRTFNVSLTSLPTVTLNEPATGSNVTTSSVVFNYTPSDISGFGNATLYSNFSGSWSANNSNATLVINASKNNITVLGLQDGLFVWNVYVCNNVGQCAFASSNNTLRKDTAAPSVSFNSPADNLNSSSQSIALNVTVSDGFTILNVSFFHNANGIWHLNSTNSSVPNASQVLLSLANFPQNNRTVWGVQACDPIGNCAFTSSNRTFIVDLSTPNVTAVNGPVNNYNSSSQSITFNVTAADNVQLANVSIFTSASNSTGLWARNATNSSLSAMQNNTPVLVTVSSIPANVSFTWVAEACDVAGNCVQYNANRTSIIDLTAPNVTSVNSPADNYNSSSQSITFNVTVKDNVQLANVSIFTSLSNSTGLWARNATNSSLSAIQNNTPILVTIASIPPNVSFTWVAEACDVAGNCAQYNANRTAIIDVTAPNVTIVNSPANAFASSSQSVTFNVTVKDNVQLANASIFHNATGIWVRNATNSSLSAIQNNTPILVTVNNLPEGNVTYWVMEACDVAGNCAFYNANRTLTVDLSAPNVTTVNSPANNLNSSSQSVTFNVTVKTSNVLANASIFHNATGVWARNTTNSSLGASFNNTPILVAVASLPEGNITSWVMEACDNVGNCAFYNANRTLIVDLTGPNLSAINSPANNLNSSSQSITFNVTVKDNVQLANASIFHNATGVWSRNATNSSLGSISNNTPILVTVNNLPEGNRTSWIMEACDVAGNCAFYNANRTFIVDLTGPNVTTINSPANNFNSSSQSVTFNVTVSDNVQLANASIFLNSTGVWLRNATNSSLAPSSNSTPIIITIGSLPEGNRTSWLMEACDVAGNCAFYNTNRTFIVDLTAPNVTASNTAGNLNASGSSITFNVTVKDNMQLANASIFLNSTGVWLRNATNSSLGTIYNNTPILVTANNLPEGNRSLWIMEACDVAGNCAFYNANQTFVVDLTSPNVSAANTANNLNSSSQSVTFNVTVKDNVQLANASVFLNASGVWSRNATNSSLSVVSNNTPILVTVSNLPEGNRTSWLMEACDVAGNCAFYNANRSFIVDLTAPTFAGSGAPADLNVSLGQSMVFSYVLRDNVQLANASLYFNASGVWLRNATNSSLVLFNNTAVNFSVSSLPEGNLTTWAMEACDAAGNCAFSSNHTFVVDLADPSVSLSEPSDGASVTSGSVVFNFTPSDDVGFGNATLYSNFSGSWAANNSNSTVVLNASKNGINVSVPAGSFVWNVRVCDVAGNCSFASSNFTFNKSNPSSSTPTPTPSGSGGGSSGGGGGSSGGFASIPNVATPQPTQAPAPIPSPSPVVIAIPPSGGAAAQITGIFSSSVGEGRISPDYILLKNDGSQQLEVLVEPSDSLKQLAQLKDFKTVIAAGSVGQISLILRAEGFKPGVYDGFFVIKTLLGEKIGEIPAHITVLRKGERKVSISVVKKPPQAVAGSSEALAVSLSNSGDPSLFNVTITTALSSSNSTLEILRQKVELSDKLYWERFVDFPQGLSTGAYTLVVSASYFNDATGAVEQASSSSQLEIVPPIAQPALEKGSPLFTSVFVALALLVLLALAAALAARFASSRAASRRAMELSRGLQDARPSAAIFALPKLKLPLLAFLARALLPPLRMPKLWLPSLPKFALPQIHIPFLGVSRANRPGLSYRSSSPFALKLRSPLQFHLPSLPRVSLPSFSMPKVVVPRISLPRFSIPRVSLPVIRLSMPQIALPRFVVPKFSLPKFSLPRASVAVAPKIRVPRGSILVLPKLALPKLVLPSLAVSLALPRLSLPRVLPPRISTPSVKYSLPSLPKISIPSAPRLSLPRISLPRFSLPGVAVPRFSLPRLSLKLPSLRLSLPRVGLPRVSLPRFSLPKFSAPSMPRVHLPVPRLQAAPSLGSSAPVLQPSKPESPLGAAPKLASQVFAARRTEFAEVFSGLDGKDFGSKASVSPAEKDSSSVGAQPAAQALRVQNASGGAFSSLRVKAQQAYSSLNLPEEKISRLSSQEAASKLDYLISDARKMGFDERLLSEADEMRQVAVEFSKQGDYRQSVAWSKQAVQKILRQL